VSQFARVSRAPAGNAATPARAARTGTAGSTGRAAVSRPGQLTARLRKLAAAGSTGALPLTGAREGTIHLRAGQVTRAESSWTPGPGTGACRPAAGVSPGPS
jgi:hypothetical protein